MITQVPCGKIQDRQADRPSKNKNTIEVNKKKLHSLKKHRASKLDPFSCPATCKIAYPTFNTIKCKFAFNWRIMRQLGPKLSQVVMLNARGSRDMSAWVYRLISDSYCFKLFAARVHAGIADFFTSFNVFGYFMLVCKIL